MRAWLSVFLAVIPLSQAAAKTVVTSGEATDCYLATLDEASTGKSEQGLAICSRAIEDAGDNPGLRAALLANSADIRVKMQDFLPVPDAPGIGIGLNEDAVKERLDPEFKML